MLGESQRNVVRLLRDVVPELAGSRPHVIVAVGEVESFAVRRNLASFETNPVDVQRATDAVLAAIALADLATAWPALCELAEDEELHSRIAAGAAGWDGHRPPADGGQHLLLMV